MNIDTGRDSVVRAMLVVGATSYDVTPSGNENKYVIYRQSPAAGRSVPAGTRIDLWLSKDKSLLDKTFDEDSNGGDGNSEEEFF
jgi:beta-lactam-binding protein with PASTA domain